jgi:hypothetical protein
MNLFFAFLRSCAVLLLLAGNVIAQSFSPAVPWHGKERSVHYLPVNNDFVCMNGRYRFNRALYGTNTGFRVEAGDLPEFALYMPGMGGNCKLGLTTGKISRWITAASSIKAIYRPGEMLYEIRDPELLGKGTLFLEVLALGNKEGMIIKARFSGVVSPVSLCWVYGGATGSKFSRDGDLGADPESVFYLQPGYCKTNNYLIDKNRFRLSYGEGTVPSEAERYEIRENQKTAPAPEKQEQKQLSGLLPPEATLHTGDATKLSDPASALAASPLQAPVVTASIKVTNKTYYFLVQNSSMNALPAYTSLPTVFAQAEAARKAVAGRCIIDTPDPFINAMGNAIAIAADAVWESPSFMHGAIAWRMRLNGWRGAYLADPLGWHDRAEEHFNGYANSQVTSPASGPVVPDTALHLARQLEKMGTAVFSSGYISRNPNKNTVPHHYDMNLVFIDQLLDHFNYMGDTAYVRKLWPVLERHLAWEKRNFDADGDGLYDAYAAIWASDALQYSGGGVTHTSAYNYKANKLAAFLAPMAGKDPAPYAAEAGKILAAMQQKLWLKDKGWFAEYKDLLGLQLVHPQAALWTVYHTIDSKVPDNFQAYQTLRYVDHEIPHIPVAAKGLKEDFYVLPTTTWQPYTWSVNNVALAENLHTALAYWQGNRGKEAYKLWKGAMVESMYLGKSPGNIQQLSFYDAVRGELYRDFADDIGMAVKSLSEGLFGIQPDALNNKLKIKPGFPQEWNSAGYEVPDIGFKFIRTGNTDKYMITQKFPKLLNVELQLNAYRDRIGQIRVNGKPVAFHILDDAVEVPVFSVNCGSSKRIVVDITWTGKPIDTKPAVHDQEGALSYHFPNANAMEVFDPQQVLEHAALSDNTLTGSVKSASPVSTVFVKVKQGQFTWWQPIDLVKKILPATPVADITGTYAKVDLSAYFNDKVTSIFTNKYLSPRPSAPTLQLPVQGIGNWCYPLTEANIDDSGLRKLAGEKDEIMLPKGVPFATPHETGKNNILFTSQWDNYPQEKTVPLTGKSSYAYFLMAGSTNPMQSRIANGELVIAYKDGSKATFSLVNPETWWPIEQDYINDGYAFTIGQARPIRVHLKTGLITDKPLPRYSSIKGFSGMGIDGGAATVLGMPLDPSKELLSVTVRALTNDVVIGLMGMTLVSN